MTSITTTATPRTRRLTLVTATPDVSVRGWVNAAAFGSIVYFALAFAMALVMPGLTLLAGQAAALILGVFAAGRLVGVTDRTGWVMATVWVVGGVAAMALVIVGIFAFLAWGPLAP